jgi:hypothetical protein
VCVESGRVPDGKKPIDLANNLSMLNSPEPHYPALSPEVIRRYRSISSDQRYGHFVRIPRRIYRCLEYFKVTAERAAVIDRLHSYYLFIGVVDDLIDSTEIEAGRAILSELETPSSNELDPLDAARVVTCVLNAQLTDELRRRVLAKFQELYEAVLGERSARSLAEFINHRKTVGRLTAELSYILLVPLMDREREDFDVFLQDVGEVGCLIDSIIDLRGDQRMRLVNFNPTFNNRMRIMVQAVWGGLKLSARHPRLFLLFLEAVADNLRDRFRSSPVSANDISMTQTEPETPVGAVNPLSDGAWTRL